MSRVKLEYRVAHADAFHGTFHLPEFAPEDRFTREVWYCMLAYTAMQIGAEGKLAQACRVDPGCPVPLLVYLLATCNRSSILQLKAWFADRTDWRLPGSLRPEILVEGAESAARLHAPGLPAEGQPLWGSPPEQLLFRHLLQPRAGHLSRAQIRSRACRQARAAFRQYVDRKEKGK